MILVGETRPWGRHSGLHRKAMAELEWLVVRDLVEIVGGVLRLAIDRGELRTEDIGAEVSSCGGVPCGEGQLLANTQRLLQWHHKAVEPLDDCRSELWFYYHLGRIIREKLADSEEQRDRPVLDLQWHYPTEGEIAEPAPRRCCGSQRMGRGRRGALGLTELQARRLDGLRVLDLLRLLRRRDEPLPARRKPRLRGTSVAPEWGWAWPANRRIIYNRASADPDGRPSSSAESCRGTRADRRRRRAVPARQAAGLRARRQHQGRRPSAETTRSSCRPTAEARCSCRPGWSIGHYHPLRAARVAVLRSAVRPAVEPGAPGVERPGIAPTPRTATPGQAGTHS